MTVTLFLEKNLFQYPILFVCHGNPLLNLKGLDFAKFKAFVNDEMIETKQEHRMRVPLLGCRKRGITL